MLPCCRCRGVVQFTSSCCPKAHTLSIFCYIFLGVLLLLVDLVKAHLSPQIVAIPVVSPCHALQEQAVSTDDLDSYAQVVESD